MLKLIVQRWCRVTESRPKIPGVVEGEGGGGYVNHFRKKESDMNLEKIYVCTCIWRLEINYLENKNGHGCVQLRWTVCNWGRGFSVWLICGSKTSGDDSKQDWVCHSEEKLWLEGVILLLIKSGIT